ncbi:NHLP bacteriocin export ABC transporter permease/ATPase subunit [Sphaerisporangium corydalis]|uniref:NHLP bacteriocin export ABC transporter permease/ATPase subunit n=1 Tax=Sphaerisporangium corydalis TaxID=1441875 RepID=A0ABV9EIZ6_9ACTN|nr:NHLP bacteriocin export ABC transporter permease/ATPase subunit [Sphaerisporangium corydalis]
MTGFVPFFAEAATPVDYSADRMHVLSDLREVLLVEEGAVDLFAVRLEDGLPVGRWNYLCRVRQGALLLGSPKGPRHSIVGRPIPGTRVSRMPLGRLRALSATGRSGTMATGEYGVAVQQFVRGLEAGIVSLAQAMRNGLPPREFVPLSTGRSTELADGEAARSVDGICWLTVEDGAIEMPEGVAGRLTAGAEVCVTERDWVVATGQTRLAAKTTWELLADETIWARWVEYATRFLYTVDRRVERHGLREVEMLTRRGEREAGAMRTARQGFDTLVRDTEARVRLADVTTDSPALAAARLVASHGGFRVTAPPPGGTHGRHVDPLQAIALVSGVRTRTVRLDEGWWKKDLGPMVGFRAADDVPVALLPIGTHYVVAQPGQTRVTPVTAAVAATLSNRAEVLYQPLPREVRTVAGLLRFGLARNRRDFWVLASLGTLVAIIGLLVPAMTGMVLGTFVARAQHDLIVEGALLVIGGALVAGALSIVQNVAALRIEGRSSSRLQAGAWTRLLSLPATFFARYSTGELGTTVLGVSAAQEMLSGVMTTATLGLFAGLANLVLVYFYDSRLALIATLLVLVSVFVCGLAGYFEVRLQRRLYEQEQKLSSRVFQLLTAVPKLRVAAAEDQAFSVWTRDFLQTRSTSASARRLQNLVTTFNAGYPLVCSVLIFAIAGGPLRGQLPIAAFLAFFAAFNLLIASVLQFTGSAITAMSIVPMLEKLAPILSAEPEEQTGKADPGDLSGRIAISRVSFRYGDDGPLVLSDIDLSVDPGEFVAIVGPTGSGKSTILRLLLGFEEPVAGTVLYDGQDLTELDIGAVRRQCGVVLQNGALLAGDIRQNIIGSTNHSVDDAWEAASMAGMAEDISAMPMGMNTVLSEGVNTLSGGQRQRIMIARALVSRPRIVFFDEATSALDNPTQNAVAESTRQLNATRIVIAHRLSTIRAADKIVVMDGGRIVQQGQYDELVSDTGGLFARLASRQM